MSYASLLTNNTAASVVADGGIIPLGTAIHGFGKAIKLNGNAINLVDTGYYRVVANASVAVTDAGLETLTLNAGGVAISGASATATATALGTVNLTVIWLVRKSCCKDTTSLTLTLSSGGTMSNVSVEVERI